MQFAPAFDWTPLLAFYHQYGGMVLGAALLLAALGTRRLGPVRFLALTLGLGMVLTGLNHLPR